MARRSLTREQVLATALELADERGLSSLTIRALASRLGVKPMAVYYHVASKEEILDGLVDAVFGEIELPRETGGWRTEVERRSRSARLVLARHSWAIGLLESRASPGTVTLRQHDAMIGTFLAGGFSVRLTAHAYALLDSYVYGFALQEASLPLGPEPTDAAAEILGGVAGEQYPHLVRLAQELITPDYTFGDEFEFGLATILDGLEAALADEGRAVAVMPQIPQKEGTEAHARTGNVPNSATRGGAAVKRAP